MEDKLLNILKKSKLDLTNLIVCPDGGGFLNKSMFDLTPTDFLRWSKIDIKGGFDKDFINSLTNSKRAIDCQIDSVLEILGLMKGDKFSNHCTDFMKLFEIDEDVNAKLKLIHCINLAPILLISKTRTLRNKLEHFYRKPTKSEVADAVDVADLFIRSVQGKLNAMENYFFITDKKNFNDSRWNVLQHLHIQFDDSNFTFLIKLLNNRKEERVLDEVIIESADKEYLSLINLMFSNSDDFECEDAFVKLLKFLGHKIPSVHVSVLVE